MFRKNFRKFIAVLLTASFVFSAAISVYGANFDDEPLQGRQIAPLVTGESRIEEIDGSIFFLVVTDEYVYSSQLTPLGYYNFAIRFTGSDQIFTTTVTVDYLTSVSVRSDSRDLTELSVAQLTEALHLMAMSSLFALDLEVVEIAFKSEVHDIPYFFEDEMSPDFAPMSAPGALFPSISALIQGEFPQPYSRRPTFQASTPGTSWGIPNVIAHTRLLETYSIFPTRVNTWNITAGLALSIIALILGPQIILNSVKAVASFAIGAGGVLVAVRNFFLGETAVAEYWERAVWINNHQRIFARAERQITWISISGEHGYQSVRVHGAQRDFTTGQFHDVIRLMSMGQDVFFREVAFGVILP